MPGGDGGALLRTLSQASILLEREAWASRRLCHLEKVHMGRQGPLQVHGTPTTALQVCPTPRMQMSLSGPGPPGTDPSGGAG